MYKVIIRPVLFLFSPEFIHKLTINLIKAGFKIPFIKYFVSNYFSVNNKLLNRTLWGLKFKNPVGLAAGLDKNGECYNELSNFGFSFIEIGTITPQSQKGNPKPRMFRLINDKGLINRMGFNNLGVNAIVKNLQRKKSDIIIGGNIGKNTLTPNETAINDYIFAFNNVYDNVDYIVVNVSCPNINNLSELQDGNALNTILNGLNTERLKNSIRKPILLKISPDLSFDQLDEILEIMNNNSIDGVIATNTTKDRDNLSLTEDAVNQIGTGGLSGTPLKERSTEIIKYIYRKTGGKLPIIGVGGIMSADDAIAKLEAGASLVQVYTGFIYEGPIIVKNINKALIKNQYISH
jgi:dihydroorotate dehydrogenase